MPQRKGKRKNVMTVSETSETTLNALAFELGVSEEEEEKDLRKYLKRRCSKASLTWGRK